MNRLNLFIRLLFKRLAGMPYVSRWVVFLKDYYIKGFVTHNRKKREYRLATLPVFEVNGEDELTALVHRYDIEALIFPTIRTAQAEQEAYVQWCSKLNLRMMIVPEVEELVDGKIQYAIREVKIEDMLERKEIEMNMQSIGEMLTAKVVLVTGAAGSIGSELCRQLAHFGVERFVMVSTDKAVVPEFISQNSVFEKLDNTAASAATSN